VSPAFAPPQAVAEVAPAPAAEGTAAQPKMEMIFKPRGKALTPEEMQRALGR
jgi:hypothetical protein